MIKTFLNRLTIAKELLNFLWKEKMWWLVPMVTILLVLGILMIFAQGSAVAPFIYTIF